MTERVFILDPGVGRTTTGHHIASIRILSNLLDGFDKVFVFDHEAGSPLAGIDGLIERVFPGSYYRILRYQIMRHHKPLRWWLQYTMAGVSRRGRPDMDGSGYRDAIATVFADHGITRDDHVLLPSASAFLVGALVAALRDLPAQCRPRLHIRMLIGDLATPPPGDDVAMTDLRALQQDGWPVHVHAEFQALADALHDRYGFDTVGVALLPLAPVFAAPGEGREDRPFTVSCLGEARREKGVDRIAGILARTAVLRREAGLTGPVRVLFQNDGRRAAKQANRALAALPRDAVVAEVMDGALSDAAFATALSGSDVALLPYALDSYAFKGSGIVADAVAMHVPIVMTHGMAMSEWVRDGNGVLADSDDDFARALVEIEREHARFRTAADVAAERLKGMQANNPMVAGIRGAGQ